MPTSKFDEKIPLTIQLPQQIAVRLKSLATKQERPAADVVVDILDRNLPRLESKKGTIPYM